MSCPYYWWNSGYSCKKSQKSVNEDLYRKFCRDYSYSDCPIYKGKETSSGCYLTSACVIAKGLADDCHELTVLRNFRDTYLSALPGGKDEVASYYQTAPLIVKAIYQLPNADSIFDALYNDLVMPCVKFIETEEYEKAHTLYRETTTRLKTQYLSE